jgi:hypothetical protein
LNGDGGGTVIVDVTILLLAPVAGFFTALWLLLLWIGDGSASELAFDPDASPSAPDQEASEETDGPFIPMPAHLTTRDEMVGWMTKELPKQLQAYGE